MKYGKRPLGRVVCTDLGSCSALIRGPKWILPEEERERQASDLMLRLRLRVGGRKGGE